MVTLEVDWNAIGGALFGGVAGGIVGGQGGAVIGAVFGAAVCSNPPEDYAGGSATDGS